MIQALMGTIRAAALLGIAAGNALVVPDGMPSEGRLNADLEIPGPTEAGE